MIVDACVVSHLSNRTPDGQPILKWLLNSKEKSGMIVGGWLTAELHKAGIGNLLVLLKQTARLHEIEETALKKDESILRASKTFKSNDVHVLALARVSRARLVFTTDGKLGVDLKNKKLVPQRISIYKNASHSHLIRNCG
jgi:hypothetical protein